MSLQHRHGLSLLELLVVVALVALLSLLLFPVFHSARRAAVRADCRSHLKQLGAAFQMYVSDWEVYPGPSALIRSPYVGSPRLPFCPDDVTERPRGAASSYLFTARVPPDFRLLAGLPEVDPNVVLVRCDHHLQQQVTVGPNDQLRRSPPRHPFYMVLRASGGVQEIPVARKRRVTLGSGPWRVDLFPDEPGYEQASAAPPRAASVPLVR